MAVLLPCCCDGLRGRRFRIVQIAEDAGAAAAVVHAGRLPVLVVLALEAQGVTPDSFCLLFSDLKTPDAYHVAVPVNTTLPWDGYEYRSLEAGWYLSTMHHGDYFSIGMAYDRLIRYAEENEHFLKPPFLECYLLDSDSVASKSQYLTQIFIGLTP